LVAYFIYLFTHFHLQSSGKNSTSILHVGGLGRKFGGVGVGLWGVAFKFSWVFASFWAKPK
jgi:hypothetical protein